MNDDREVVAAWLVMLLFCIIVWAGIGIGLHALVRALVG